ncbi:ferrochelatase [Terrihabitans rhizophilus]|uniref:Ferrochelatase n=1 Tax=Terrihabitans rhizophilus TaxID=3092662 RepID=A0ABU4RQR3_9HYPH|nr:ferrochelatase [Terrihabitans sp. PJ23]MDX6807179.1 ferrochelatase [Terrihabitans sp. PJ23]
MPKDPSRAVRLPHDHVPVKAGRIGVLVVNLGTPDGTTYWPMRRYLKEFLSDRRVIETPRWLWWPILNLIILTKRPGPKGRDYASIWNDERDEGPLKTITRAQTEKLAARLADLGDDVVFDWAMRYGNPSIASRIDALHAQGCERLLVVPMYPQYAAATTATVCDKVFDKLKSMRWQPILRVAPPWHDDPVYIHAVKGGIEEHLATLDWTPDVILSSFHGVPKSYLLKGDPYHCHCAKTWRLLREAMGMDDKQLRLGFQSRFGTEEWLRPYTDETVKDLARSGVKNLAVVTPGFTSDCLETIEEIGVENAEYFHENGGVNFTAIPCLNDTDRGMDVLETVTRRELMGWV